MLWHTILVNALQRKARVVLQKCLREDIPLQIRDGENGFLVSSIEEADEPLRYSETVSARPYSPNFSVPL
jgi:hypothetical protein